MAAINNFFFSSKSVEGASASSGTSTGASSSNFYVSGINFDTSSGDLTLNRVGLSDLIVSLDDRYLELTGGTLTGALTVSSGDLTVSNGNLSVIGNVTGNNLNISNWDAAYNDKINSASFSGGATNTLTLTQQDGGTVTASFDNTYLSGGSFSNGDLILNRTFGGSVVIDLDGRYQLLSEKGAANGYTPLDSNGLIPQAYLPPVTITETFVVASEAAQLALTAQQGDVAVRTDLNESYILQGTDPSVLGDWQELLSPTAAVQSVNGLVGAVTLDLGFSSGTLSLTGSGATVDLDSWFDLDQVTTNGNTTTNSITVGGSTVNGTLNVNSGNGNQLSLDNGGERFTQIDFNNNGNPLGRLWYDDLDDEFVSQSNNSYSIYTGGAGSSFKRLAIDATGNLAVDTNTLFVNATNNTVLMGTTVDSGGGEKLQVTGNSFFGGDLLINSSSADKLILRSTTNTGDNYIALQNSGLSTLARIGFVGAASTDLLIANQINNVKTIISSNGATGETVLRANGNENLKVSTSLVKLLADTEMNGTLDVTGSATFRSLISSYNNNTQTLFTSYNTGVSNAQQFWIAHDNTDVTIDNFRGNINIATNVGITGNLDVNGRFAFDVSKNGVINTANSLLFNIDSDNNNTGEKFEWATNRDSTTGGTVLMQLFESGNLAVNTDTLFVDATNNSVLLGSTVDSGNGEILQVTGNSLLDGTLDVGNITANSGGSNSLILAENSNASSRLGVIGTYPQLFLNTSGFGNTVIDYNNVADTLQVVVNNSVGKISFQTNSVERLLITNSLGSLTTDFAVDTDTFYVNATNNTVGINTTPLSTFEGILELGNTGSMIHGGGDNWSSANFLYISNNAYHNNGAFRAKRTNPSVMMTMNNDSVTFASTSSTSASSILTFTDRLVINSTGITVTGTVVATGGNSTEWNTAYDRSIDTNPTISGGVLTLTQQDASTLTASFDSDDVPEGVSNLYFTNARARSAVSFVAGSGAYDSSTGVFTIPTNNNQITNGAGYITATSIPTDFVSASTGGTFLGAIDISVASGTPNLLISGYDTIDWSGFTLKFGGITASQWSTISFQVGGAEEASLSSSGFSVAERVTSKGLDLTTASGDVALTVAAWDVIDWAGSTLEIGGITASQWATVSLKTGGTDRVRINSDGTVDIANLSGSGNRIVVADASGTLVDAVIGSGLAFDGTTLTASGGSGGTISGSGTSGKITKWTGATAIGDSIMEETGSTITVAGNLDVTSNITVDGIVSFGTALSPTSLIHYGSVSIPTFAGSGDRLLAVDSNGLVKIATSTVSGGGATNKIAFWSDASTLDDTTTTYNSATESFIFGGDTVTPRVYSNSGGVAGAVSGTTYSIKSASSDDENCAFLVTANYAGVGNNGATAIFYCRPNDLNFLTFSTSISNGNIEIISTGTSIRVRQTTGSNQDILYSITKLGDAGGL